VATENLDNTGWEYVPFAFSRRLTHVAKSRRFMLSGYSSRVAMSSHEPRSCTVTRVGRWRGMRRAAMRAGSPRRWWLAVSVTAAAGHTDVPGIVALGAPLHSDAVDLPTLATVQSNATLNQRH
jgi:hypothetical protein